MESNLNNLISAKKKKQLKNNLKDILKYNYKIQENNKILIIYDEESFLSNLIFNSFQDLDLYNSNNKEFIKFNSDEIESLISKINSDYKKDDIVVLIQSSSFRVSNYRWRNLLCQNGLKVLEFGQLGKMDSIEEYNSYINSLDCDFFHYKKLSEKLIPKIEKSSSIKFISENGSLLEYKGEMDKCLKNTGEFWEQTNWSSRFPIGEIISEGKNLSILNGELEVYAYPNIDKQITTFVKPFTCKIENGFLVSHKGNEEFEELIQLIKTENEKGLVYVRELGLGLNRGIKRFDKIKDPVSYERQEGLHFSLGMKHGMYQKKLWKEYGKKFNQRFHVDIYVNIDKIFIDEELVFSKEKGYIV